MFRSYEEGCSKYIPTMRLTCIVLATILLVFEVCLAAYEYINCRVDGNPISALFAAIFTFHSFLTLFYIIGAFRLIECFMVPWLTFQLIFLTTFSLLIIVWWIATLLAVFGLVTYYTTLSEQGLTNSEFFVFTGSLLTIILVVSLKISHILYKGFINVRNQNIAHYRITEAMSRKNSILKPSYV
ncbi:unnamed protein product [Caenorhabditis angaria]|uniref:Uncharacterized protein n=1 Tax=Caenorhabditis angaria TaxID=860376 RepID=A0A9P1MVH9_9PELO|nr:unnamed protein product [Caenorhabditis angaria]